MPNNRLTKQAVLNLMLNTVTGEQHPGSLLMDAPERSNTQHLEALAEDTKKWNQLLLTKFPGQQTAQPTKPGPDDDDGGDTRYGCCLIFATHAN